MDDDNDKNDNIELQKFTILCGGVGTLLYSTKQKGLYKPGLMTIIVCTVLSTIIEADSLGSDMKEYIPKYIATFIFIITMYLIYRLYNLHEDYLHKNNIEGDFKKYSKHITYILIIVFVMQLFFAYDFRQLQQLQDVKDKIKTPIMVYSLALYIMTLKLILIYVDMYMRLQYVIMDKNLDEYRYDADGRRLGEDE